MQARSSSLSMHPLMRPSHQLVRSQGGLAHPTTSMATTPAWIRKRQRRKSLTAYSAAKGPIGCVVQSGGQTFRWGSFLSRGSDLPAAVAEATAAILGQIGGTDANPDLALVFASNQMSEGIEELVPLLRTAVPSLRCVYGCTVRGR